MENKTNVFVALVVGVVAVAVAFVSGNANVVVQTPAQVIQSNQSLGAVPSPDLQSQYFGYGNVRKWAYRCDLGGTVGQASTTVCTIKAPPSSSSTLRMFGYRADTGTSTAMVLKTFKSASPYLVTTQLGDTAPLAANTIVPVVSTSTLTNSTNALFGASDWLVVTATVAAGGNGTSSPRGVVFAEFTEL